MAGNDSRHSLQKNHRITQRFLGGVCVCDCVCVREYKTIDARSQAQETRPALWKFSKQQT
jgi:hypothetical protein